MLKNPIWIDFLRGMSSSFFDIHKTKKKELMIKINMLFLSFTQNTLQTQYNTKSSGYSFAAMAATYNEPNFYNFPNFSSNTFYISCRFHKTGLIAS